MTKTTPFKDWAKASGFSGKQISEAGATIGFAKQVSRDRSSGRTQSSHIEQLGLTAAYFGFPPWDVGFSALLDDDARAMIRLAKREVDRCLAKRAEAGKPESAPHSG